MNYQGDIAQSLVEEILDLIGKYHDTMMVATALGCLEIVKAQILQDHLEVDDE
jgi:hypothetical protein